MKVLIIYWYFMNYKSTFRIRLKKIFTLELKLISSRQKNGRIILMEL